MIRYEDAPKRHGPGRYPRSKDGAARVRVTVRLTESEASRLDKLRGSISRAAWLRLALSR